MDEQRDILDLGEISDNEIGAARPRRRRLRRLAEPALLAAAVVALVLMAQHASAPPPSPAGPVNGAPAAAEPSGHPAVVAPSTARAGQVITVSTFRRRNLCGAVEITFDGIPVRQERVRYSGALNPGWRAMQVTFRISPAAAVGSHEIALRGPTPDCGPRVELAVATITVIAPEV
jgi:hypothetical protein